MEQVTIRNSLTSRGISALSPWADEKASYSILKVNLGTNPISSLEVVSSLNCFNLTYGTYYYSYINRPEKYNPKVYLGAVQSVAREWNFDAQSGNPTGQKSGSIN